MKCSHPTCNRGVGLVSHRRLFSKALYCSRQCRDNYAVERAEPASARAAVRLLAWLCVAPADAQSVLASEPVRVRAR